MDPQTLAGSWQPTETTDHELVEQCKHGDEEAMAKLVRRHYGSSLRIARSIVRSHSDSEDAVQTAYGRAFQHLHTFRKEARFSTWITSIVVNQTRMHLRSQRRAILLSLDEPIHEQTPLYLKSRDPSPEESTARHETSTAISRAVARLPNGLRMPYTLHAVSGLPIDRGRGQIGTQRLRDQVTDLPRALHPRVPLA